MIDEGPHEIALRLHLELSGHPRRTLAAICEREQAAPCGRKLLAYFGLGWLDALEQNRGRVAKDEGRAEAERPDQLGPLASCRAAVRADARPVVLLAPERQSAIGCPIDNAPAGIFVEPETACGRGRIGCKKPVPSRDVFLLRRVVSGVFRIFRPAIAITGAVEGELIPRWIAQRRRQAWTCLDPLQEGFTAFKTAYHLQDRCAAGWAFVGALREDATKGPVRRSLRARGIDAAPDTGNGALEGMKPDRREAFFLHGGRIPRRARHRKDEISRINTVRL